MIYILGATRLKKDMFPKYMSWPNCTVNTTETHENNKLTAPTAFFEDILYLLSLCCQHCSFSQLKELRCGLPQGKLAKHDSTLQAFYINWVFLRACCQKAAHRLNSHVSFLCALSRHAARCMMHRQQMSNCRCSGSKLKSRMLTEWRALLCRCVCWWTNQKPELKCVILCTLQISHEVGKQNILIDQMWWITGSFRIYLRR